MHTSRRQNLDNCIRDTIYLPLAGIDRDINAGVNVQRRQLAKLLRGQLIPEHLMTK